jgi:hypothetical protein
MKKCAQHLTMLFLLLIFILNACSIPARLPVIDTSAPSVGDTSAPVSSATPSPSAETASQSPDSEATDAVSVQLRFISGILDSITARTLTIETDDGAAHEFGYMPETVDNVRQSLVPAAL